jgi:hypothetical protein
MRHETRQEGRSKRQVNERQETSKEGRRKRQVNGRQETRGWKAEEKERLMEDRIREARRQK